MLATADIILLITEKSWGKYLLTVLVMACYLSEDIFISALTGSLIIAGQILNPSENAVHK